MSWDREQVVLHGADHPSPRQLPLPPPARNCCQASLMRSAWPGVNMSMQESCV